ncbi:uncharacterized protein LOC124788714 [Schistocerca piceifrons]|uniref:uncharacterized protein LOC124788714 n=1 Tax=Schistocerca piceifrons TaxID=274613 RepID=UPI001F5ECDD5|nr:uncharacterized protein LOC124788714 [Schistocerca piceifrons]
MLKQSTWRCSICRRKLQSRAAPPVMTQESTDSLLDVPVLEALQRRHSDVKIGSGSSLTVSGGGGSGLAPPRSPELRRHSDVSPASLKELEKELRAGGQGIQQAQAASSEPLDVSVGVAPPGPVGRRASFRVVPQPQPQPPPQDKADDGTQAAAWSSYPQRTVFQTCPLVADSSPSPLSPDATAQAPAGLSLGVEEDRRTRRRGSQLPDLGMRALPQTPPSSGTPTPRGETTDAVRRQTSVTDGEAIKIVIHDVDCDFICGSKRRVVLRRDPADKAHRSEYRSTTLLFVLYSD